ncbi:MAG TPA: LON peptidase substrate-binding domain-containing protein [Nitrospiraceae bacterium]|nr:LON peptidase substrate-binding domain-containing protein [Nitrospiraceae bacterium]
MQIQPNRTHQGKDQQDEGAVFRVPECIPVFPLPNIVFFPKIYLPLHIFEPRYREMVTDAAAQGQCIGMALLKEGWEPEYYGNPPIFEIGCVGRLVSVQRLLDGRFNILLQGLHRYEIREQFYDKSYRQASVVFKPREPGTELEVSVRSDLIRALDEYLRQREDSPLWQGFFRLDVNDEILVNTLSTHLQFTPLEKQFLLEADSLQQQARRLSDLIQFKIHECEGTKGRG